MIESDEAKVLIVWIVAFLIFILIMALAPTKNVLIDKCLELAKDHKQVIECQKEISVK